MNIFNDLRAFSPNEQVPGYRGFGSYPSDYQAAQFPAHGDSIRITGNNQAFFFAQGEKNAAGKIVDVKLNTRALEELVANIVGQGATANERPIVRLQIDADVFENPERFIKKYQDLRPEPEQAKREEWLGKEAEIIRDFVNEGGLYSVVKQALQSDAKKRGEDENLNDTALKDRAEEFLRMNFKLEGLRTEQPMQFATWEIISPQGEFAARQEYKNSTSQVDRPWQLGTDPQLSTLAAHGHKGAQQVLDAVIHTGCLEIVTLNNGLLPEPSARRPAPLAARPELSPL